MKFRQCNPCVCCHAEVGVYILSYCQSLFITGALILGGALGFTTVPILAKPDSEEPFYRKAALLFVLVLYCICSLLEIGLHEYLHKTLNLKKEIKLTRCRKWVTLKIVLFILCIPIVPTHLWVDFSSFKIVLYLTAVVYQSYYIWVVHHYTVEIVEEINSTKEKSESEAVRNVISASTTKIV